jgi:hypothetical protein
VTENEFLLFNYSYIEHQSHDQLYCVQRIDITYNGIQWHTYHKFIIQFCGDIKQSALIFFISASYDYNNTTNNNDCGEKTSKDWLTLFSKKNLMFIQMD